MIAAPRQVHSIQFGDVRVVLVWATISLTRSVLLHPECVSDGQPREPHQDACPAVEFRQVEGEDDEASVGPEQRSEPSGELFRSVRPGTQDGTR